MTARAIDWMLVPYRSAIDLRCGTKALYGEEKVCGLRIQRVLSAIHPKVFHPRAIAQDDEDAVDSILTDSEEDRIGTLVFTQHSSHFTCANAVSGPSSIQSPRRKGIQASAMLSGRSARRIMTLRRRPNGVSSNCYSLCSQYSCYYEWVKESLVEECKPIS